MRRHAGLFLFVSTIFVVVFGVFLAVQPRSDLDLHLEVAASLHSISDITYPHFLLQLLVKAWVALGVPDRAGLALLLGGCYGGMAVLFAREVERRGAAPRKAQLWALTAAVLVASHVFLPTVPRHNFYYGYFVPVVYHNPTQQLCKLFALWIWFRYCRDFLGGGVPAWPRSVQTGVLCALSAIAKPSFLIAFLPLSGLLALWDLVRGRWARMFRFGFGIAVPATAVLLAQAYSFYGPEAGGELIFAPFAVFNAAQTRVKLPLSLLFPLVLLATTLVRGARHEGRDAPGRRAAWRAVWALAAIGLFETLCLGERSRLMDGNFAWTGQTCVFLLYVESLLLLMTARVALPARALAWTAFALHVLSGAIWYGAVFFPERVNYL
jgi:hypothetical protein